AAVELELVPPVVGQRAFRVDQEVGVVERGVDVGIELPGGVLERPVVVAFELRINVAREELPAVDELLAGVELDGVVHALRLGRRHRRVIVEGHLFAKALAGIRDEVRAFGRYQEVLDDASEVPVNILDADAQILRNLVLATDEELVDVLTPEVWISRRRTAEQ